MTLARRGADFRDLPATARERPKRTRLELDQLERGKKKVNGNLVKRIGSALMLLLPSAAWADKLNLREGVTAVSRSEYDLHMLILYVCCVIGLIVFGAMAYSLYHHRKSRGVVAAQFHDSTRLEIVWTIIPTIILVLMAWPATTTLIDIYKTGNEDMLIEVRGFQWKWQYKYLDENRKDQLSFFSVLATPQDEIYNRKVKGEHYLLEVDNPLRVPVGKRVRLLITSNDVIHSWSVPDFGIKRDAIPGMLNDVWFEVNEPGIFRGQCSELCGKDHGFMPVVVQAMAADEYQAWYTKTKAEEDEKKAMASKTFTADELMKTGGEIYNKTCATCHQPDGKGLPPAFPPLAGSKIATGALEDHIAIVWGGKTGTAMQAFGASGQLNAADIAAVIHYERHSFGNNTSDVVQPVDVVNWTSAHH